MEILTAIIQLLGGLAMFLYGIEVMGDGLKNSSGAALKRVLEKVTGNVVMGVLTGALVTAVIQSSTATIVLTVALIGAGVLNLKQAVSIVMGANIGTTVTAQIIRLGSIQSDGSFLLWLFDTDTLAPIAPVAGIVLLMFIKMRKSVVEVKFGSNVLSTIFNHSTKIRLIFVPLEILMVLKIRYPSHSEHSHRLLIHIFYKIGIFRIDLFAVLIILSASLRGDGETLRNGKTDIGHFRKVCALTAEKFAHFRVTFGKEVNVLFLCHLIIPPELNIAKIFIFLISLFCIIKHFSLIYKQFKVEKDFFIKSYKKLSQLKTFTIRSFCPLA